MLPNNKRSKKTGRQLFFTISGILCVCFLFLFALLFPKYYYQLYDNRTFNQIATTDIQLRTYETSYDSFEEKLHALAKAHMKNNNLRAVPIHDLEIGLNGNKLTDIANEQLKQLKKYHVLEQNITLKKKKLKTWERYTIYSNQDLQGFSCWLLIYVTSKKEITLYLDEEFHKIFFLKIKEKSAKEIVNSDTTPNVAYSSSISYYPTTKDKMNQKQFYTWWNGMIQYYGLDSRDFLFYPNSESLYGELEFDDSSHIMFYQQYSFDENRREIYSMGIPIEKMIQF